MPVLRSTRRKTTYSEYASGQSDDSGSEFESGHEQEIVKPKRKQPKKNPKSKKQDFEENSLYKALSSPEVAAYELALGWIEDYSTDKSEAFTTLFNLLLRCCGCVSLVQPHDLANLDLASDTVGELCIMFEGQKYHEYPFISNNKNLRFFRKNVVSFFEHLVSLAHENGLLYKQQNDDDENFDENLSSSHFMTTLLTWFSSLSSCTIRPFRFVATTVVLTIQTSLCTQIASVLSSLEKHQRQLSSAKSGNNRRKNDKIKSISNAIDTYHMQKETIKEYFQEITDTVFIHRYRDVEPLIRQECMKQLGLWMTIYPENFFESSFLRYFGWLLSDPDEHVRAEVSRVLLRLYKSNLIMGIGFRQFTERFKKQLINMSWQDKDFNVKINLTSVLKELLRTGFLDEDDIYEVTLNLFFLTQHPTSTGNDEKLKLELCKFVASANTENVKSELEKYTIFIESYQSPQFGSEPGKLNLELCLKFKNLIHMLRLSYDHYETKLKGKLQNPIALIFAILYSLPEYSGQWEFLLRYLQYDLSSISFTSDNESIEADNVEITDFKKLLELGDERDEIYLLSFVCGSIILLSSRKTKRADAEENADSVANVYVKLVNYLPSLCNLLVKSHEKLLIFLSLWCTLIGNKDSNIYSFFQNLNQVDSYRAITKILLDFFQNYDHFDVVQDTLLSAYDPFFEILLADYNGSSMDVSLSTSETRGFSVMDSELRVSIQSLVQNITAEIKDCLTSPSAQDPFNDTMDDDLEYQRTVCNLVTESSRAVFKLAKIGNYISINDNIGDAQATTTLIDTVNSKVLSKFDAKPLAERWSHNFLQSIDDIILSFKVLLDMVLVTGCWRLDKLIYIPSIQQSQIDIEFVFDDFSATVDHLLRIMITLGEASRGMDDSEVLRKLKYRLSELKTLLGAKFIDLVVSFKVFYVKCSGNSSFTNFDSFFKSSSGMGKFIHKVMPLSAQTCLLEDFLVKESRLASLLDVELDRSDEEDVNFDDLTEGIPVVDSEIVEEAEDVESEDESEETQEKLASKEREREELKKRQHQQKVWVVEKDLCVYIVKMFSLINTGMVSDFVLRRMKLNAEKIGGLYLKILSQNESKDNLLGKVLNENNEQSVNT